MAGGPLLMALVAGEAAHNFETTPPTDAVSSVLQILRGESINSIIKIVLLQKKKCALFYE